MTLFVPTVSQTDCDLHIGRVVPLTAAGATGQFHPVRWDESGPNKIKVSGVVYAPRIVAAKTLRAQILGHVDNLDDEVVPVRWDADPTVAGYYRVLGAEVAMHGPALSNGIFDVSIDLERTDYSAAPVFESVLTGATLTNALGINGAPFLALPHVGTLGQSNVSFSTNEGRTATDGAMRIFFFSVYPVVNRYVLLPAYYYVGAATFEMDDDFTVLQVVTGTQCENKPIDWRLSNGLVRVTPVGTAGRIDVEHFDGTVWEAAKRYNIGPGTGATLNFEHVAILRNSPEEVVIRLTAANSAGLGEGRTLVDLSLRRGDNFVRIYISSEVAHPWAVGRDTAEAATSITGGIRATANDAGGNRYVLVSPTATTKNTVQGSLTLPSSATTASFGIGNSIGGSAATNPNVITGTRGMVEQYFAAQSEVMSVAGQ